MSHIGIKKPILAKQFKYEMEKRKEKWKSINEPLEKLLMIPLEAQAAVVGDLVSKTCYNNLATMLSLPPIHTSLEPCPSSVDTVIPYTPAFQHSLIREPGGSLAEQSKLSLQSTQTESVISSQYDSTSGISNTIVSNKHLSLSEADTKSSTEKYEVLSDFVEVEKKIPQNQELVMKHKAILKFLGLSEAEAATWRVKEAKDVSELSEMTLEEQGDFLINKIAIDFCDWMRKLGGDEKSFISEEILKELFQIGMDNPASRAICIKLREKRVLYHSLADFLQVPEKSFHEVLAMHLNWDAEVEKKPTRVRAFGKSLPKDLRFKTPKNKTAETWLEWNKMSTDQLTFADVYKNIKDLRSTREYCKWLMAHPEHKKPQYLVDQGIFERGVSGRKRSGPRKSSLISAPSQTPRTSANTTKPTILLAHKRKHT